MRVAAIAILLVLATTAGLFVGAKDASATCVEDVCEPGADQCNPWRWISDTQGEILRCAHGQ